jgi:hypothetical protein
MPKDAAGLETYPSYDRLVELLRAGAAPDEGTPMLLAYVVATNMSQDFGWTVHEGEIMADAIKQAARNMGQVDQKGIKQGTKIVAVIGEPVPAGRATRGKHE